MDTKNEDAASVLFVCAGQAGLALMAKGFARQIADEKTTIACAGIAAGTPHPLASDVMAEVGINISKQEVPAFHDLSQTDYDVAVIVCDQTPETCTPLPGTPELVLWSLPDPFYKGKATPESFRAIRDEIRRLVGDLFQRGYLAALHHARQSADVVLNHISEGIIAHDLERRIFYFNRAAEEITGYSRSEVLNKDCHEVFPGRFCGGKCLFCDDLESAKHADRRELEIHTKSGEKRILDMSIRPMENQAGTPVGVLAAFRDLTRERQLARRIGRVHSFSGIVGNDPVMLDIFDLIRDLADSDIPVFVHGESGTGKELIAAAIHNEGQRADRLFVPVNCGALPEGLLESELFGHVRGAFTGAIRDKKGRFELADEGTIFLDEIGDLSPGMQVKLLRVLQEGTFERVGSEETQKVNVRVISATNKDLSQEMDNGRFREDLFYRLNVVPIELPPLRQRRNDIPAIVKHILERELTESSRAPVTLSQEALDFMLGYDWPGNVRELQNWLQFALVKCKGPVIQIDHLPPSLHGPGRSVRKRRRKKLDVDSVRLALNETDGNKVKAAQVLGVSRATLYRFLDETNIG
ncbi:MAG: sigma 54-interacting transcriptional regulator [Lentisphaerae bacterium]|jgi:sigma-54 dependent transcriptional regulator, acetoin dehydrogenase operon transcriptional activator AcoR|nr:sigma 54-interacting transcriptional regulator [Lentisphaerota bacterium]MBT4814354.1 sigma 54-interacting transcriptional regulator [Lentisphaerota bacterium]MBT5609276.1 sigma 54-interacting transcriptional regulator [Lentisphaerota bacterium]MBT7059430.1 sigma 54-interacting transcriptional regulator [Lentisphaerota bacterium]MBT7847814.1 sigma 54-interacting transcriptional regulator [Lentisphaerota bacterium]